MVYIPSDAYIHVHCMQVAEIYPIEPLSSLARWLMTSVIASNVSFDGSRQNAYEQSSDILDQFCF